MTEPVKGGITFTLTDEMALYQSGFPQKGVRPEVPLTDGDIAAHARAKAALEELQENPWVHFYEDEGYVLADLKPHYHFETTETVEEWKERWIAEGRPMPLQDAMLDMFNPDFSKWIGKTVEP